MGVISGVFEASFELFVQMSAYLLFGFFFAGLLHVFIPLEWVGRHLGKSSVGSVVKAVLFGIPLPLCSCGVIPAAISLRQKGASKGSTLSFLIATPITGIDSIMATYSLMGYIFTLFRILAACLTALVAGILANIFTKEMHIPNNLNHSNHKGTCCHNHTNKEKKPKSPVHQRIHELFRYAFVTLLGDISLWLLIGVLVGGLIAFLMPPSFIEQYLGTGWLAMVLMLIVGIPMYICATASIPIAAALMFKGLSPGAALVFLLAGPATNAVTVTVVTKELGKAAVFLYLLAISVMSIVMGVTLDWVWDLFNVDIMHQMTHAEMLPTWLNYGSAFILFVLMLLAFIRKSKERFSTK